MRVGAPTVSRRLGIRSSDIHRIGLSGLGDGYNSYAHAMLQHEDKLYVGVSRCVFQALSLHHHSAQWRNIEHWPVESPTTGIDGLYTELDRRGQIWSYSFSNQEWKKIYTSPVFVGETGEAVPREFGYRCMTKHQWPGEGRESIYVTTTATGRSPGPVILRFGNAEEISMFGSYGLAGLPITSIRSLVSFKGSLYASPSGSRGSRSNTCDYPFVYRCSDPGGSMWEPVSTAGFGDDNNITIFTLYSGHNYLYAGTLNNSGCQVWRTDGEIKDRMHSWECILSEGGGRGSLNQAVACICEHENALYVGTGIQNGGYDIANSIGPAAAELLRITPRGKVEVICGSGRNSTPTNKEPVSGLGPGFGNPLNGYIWSLCSHNGWLYAGTCNIGVLLEYVQLSGLSNRGQRLIKHVGIEKIVRNQGGAELWGSPDGDNWILIASNGIGNKYNLGVRNLISHDQGLIIGTANPFGPSVFTRMQDGSWTAKSNPQGGFEVCIAKRL